MYTNDELTYQKREIIDAKSKRGFWLFDVVTVGAVTYRWTDFSSKTWDGNTYTFKIVAMSDIEEIDVGMVGFFRLQGGILEVQSY